jgi:hypothetical protein
VKALFWILVISISTYWISKPFAREEVKREIAQANAIQTQTPIQLAANNSVEDDARKTVQAYRQRGIPRKASEEFNVIGADAVGTQVVITYEFSAPAVIPITSQLVAEMRSEVTQNFRRSEYCTNNALKALLQRGMSIVHHYRLYRTSNTILSVQLGIREC